MVDYVSLICTLPELIGFAPSHPPAITRLLAPQVLTNAVSTALVLPCLRVGTLITALQQAIRIISDLLGAQESIQCIVSQTTSHGCHSVNVGSETINSEKSEKRRQDSYAPIRNPIYPPDVLKPLHHHAARVLYFLSRDSAIAANLDHEAISLAQAYDAQHRHKVLGPSEQVRHKMFSLIRWRENKRPHAGGLDGAAALGAFVCGSEIREV
jgi:hypothetical protein